VSSLDRAAPPRKLAYRWFVAGAEVAPERFFAELRRLGGRAIVEAVDVPWRAERRGAPGGPFVVTPAGRAALRRAEGGTR
jgi:hypothetical protein